MSRGRATGKGYIDNGATGDFSTNVKVVIPPDASLYVLIPPGAADTFTLEYRNGFIDTNYIIRAGRGEAIPGDTVASVKCPTLDAAAVWRIGPLAPWFGWVHRINANADTVAVAPTAGNAGVLVTPPPGSTASPVDVDLSSVTNQRFSPANGEVWALDALDHGPTGATATFKVSTNAAATRLVRSQALINAEEHLNLNGLQVSFPGFVGIDVSGAGGANDRARISYRRVG